MENISNEELQQLIAEAEQRGYNRGLNEQIENRMRAPGVWEQPSSPPSEGDGGFEILANRRRSVWD